jgi:pseudaminic acid biosynthesis-associated methylase
MNYETAQERFWAGQFGADYIARNSSPGHLAASIAMFTAMLARTERLNSVLELGANIGLNMRSLRMLLPHARLEAVEINPEAYSAVSKIEGVTAHNTTLLGFRLKERVDLAFTCGVLIHIAPEALSKAYETLYECSNRYILVAEYYSPSPVEIPYRGERERLFKRDFAGDLLETYPKLRLLDYGVFYRRDTTFKFDDTNWYLLEKR